MKKSMAMVWLALALLMLTACKKEADPIPPSTEVIETQTQETIPSALECAGVYWRAWSEEIGGTVVEMNTYLVLNEDHTGFWIAQDVGTLTWDERRLTLTVGAAYEFALTEENGTVNLLLYESQDENGEWNPTTFAKIEALPEEMEAMISERGA